MDSANLSPEEIVSDSSIRLEQSDPQKSSNLKATKIKPSNIQEGSSLTAQGEQAAASLHSTDTLTQSKHSNYGRLPDHMQESIQMSGVVTSAQVGNRKSFRRAPQGRQATFPPTSSASRTHDRSQGEASGEHQELRKSLSTSSREPHHKPPISSRAQHLEEQYANTEQHYTEFKNQLKKNQAALTSLRAKLAESESRRAELQQHLEEASNTIFRLRPQRQEYTESEIDEDYRKLTKVIQNWISMNCESFIDDDLRGFDTIGSYRLGPGAHPETFEAIIYRFQSKPNCWTDAKEYVLEAVVMRYIFDRILQKPFSVLLGDSEQHFLAAIQNSMGNMEPQKDLLTIRTWKSDTTTAIEGHDSFANRYPGIEEGFAVDLYNILKRTFSSQNNESILQSLCKSVIAPAIKLARKTQAAISIWTFEYSDYSQCQPGEFGSNLPDFLTFVQKVRCINMSNGDKLLKPDIDLRTREQQEALVYVLEVFPSLYCQRVTAGDALPVLTMSQPLLLVAFATAEPPAPTQRDVPEPANPRTVNQIRQSSPARPDSKGRGFIQVGRKYLGL